MTRSPPRLPVLVLFAGLLTACAGPPWDRLDFPAPEAASAAEAPDETAAAPEPPSAAPAVPARKPRPAPTAESEPEPEPRTAADATAAPTGEEKKPQDAPGDEETQEDLAIIMPQSPPTGQGPQPEASAIVRCREAVDAAQQAVNRYLDLPEVLIDEKEWVEDALRVTEVALLACQGQDGEQAATYWRATAFFLHGQYARAALNYRRVAEMEGPYNAQGYAVGLAELLEVCLKDRQGLDDYRLGGLYEAAGIPRRAAVHYTLAARTACKPLQAAAEQRLKIVSPPDKGT